MHSDALFKLATRDRLAIEMERAQANRTSAKKEDPANPERIQKAAQEFEALFVNHLIKTMQETVGESELFGKSLGADSYRDLMFQELAQRITQNGGIGLAKQLIAHLQADAPTKPPNSGAMQPGMITPPRRPINYAVLPGPNRPPASIPSPPEPSPVPSEAEPSFILPVQGHQTSGYGLRTDPMHGHIRFHRGVDLAAPKGSPILAARSGQVVFSGYRSGYGNTVVIEHADGYRTRYAHLQNMSVKKGDYIAQGEPLGRVGQTGRATGPHLHFEVWRNNTPINPHELLSESTEMD